MGKTLAGETGSRMTARIWSLVALALGLVCSALVAHWQHGKLVDDRRVQLSRIAARSAETLNGELAFASQMIRSLQAAFLSADDISAPEFATLHRILDKDHYVPALRLLEYAVGRPGPDGRAHFVIEMVAPAAGNQALIGVDVATRPNDLEALLPLVGVWEGEAPAAGGQGGHGILQETTVSKTIRQRPPSRVQYWRLWVRLARLEER